MSLRWNQICEWPKSRRKKGILIEIGTFENWDPAERSFDLIVFGQSFHWVNPDIASLGES